MAKLFAFNIHGHQHIVENNWNGSSCVPHFNHRIPNYDSPMLAMMTMRQTMRKVSQNFPTSVAC